MRAANWVLLGVALGVSLPAMATMPHCKKKQADCCKEKRPDSILLLNAHNREENQNGLENQTCLVPASPAPDYQSKCTPGMPKLYLVQGQRTELRVFNRKFFADYSLTVDKVTPIASGPQIRNLSEAENLTLGAPSFAAAPPSKGGVETVKARTAFDVLNELLDETTATEPQSDLDGDKEAIKRERLQIRRQIAAFREGYLVLRGTPGAPADCGRIGGSPDVNSLCDCLGIELTRETSAPWAGAGPYSDEQEFRNVVTRVEDLIKAVKRLGTNLAATNLMQSAQQIEDSVTQHEKNLITYKGNIEAAADAADLFCKMLERPQETDGVTSVRTELRKQQLRALLTQKLKAPSDTKPVLDEAEMNHLLEKYELFLKATKSVPRARGTTLRASAVGYRSGLPPIDEFRRDVGDIRNDLDVDLPQGLDEVNAKQGSLLARVNEIYDHSEVCDPLPIPIDLSGHSGNLVVYFTIRRIETFTRYSVTPVQAPPSAAQVSAAGTPLPPPAKGGAPGGAAQTAAAPNGGSDGSAPAAANSPVGDNAPNQGNENPPPGIVVAKGQFEVHDLYHATVVAAFAFSFFNEDQTIAKQPQPKACMATSTTTDNNCFSPKLVNTSPHFEPIVGVDVYIRRRDTYPDAHNSFLQKFGVMGAVSVSPANSYFIGPFYEPLLGIQFAGGLNVGTQKTLQSTFKFDSPVDMTSDFPTVSKQVPRLFFSAGLDLAIFRKIFGKVTGIGTAASTTQGK